MLLISEKTPSISSTRELVPPTGCATPGQQKPFGKLLYCPKVISFHGWLIFVIHCLCPFSVAQDKNLRARIRQKQVALNTTKLFVSTLTSRVEDNISKYLPDRLALLLDGIKLRKRITWLFLQRFRVNKLMATASLD